jgi:hypothetical protein
VRDGGADPVEDAAGGGWARVARAAPLLAAAKDVRVPLGDDVHVGRRRVHVGSGLEVRTQRGGQLGIAKKKAAALGTLRERGNGQHRLPAAEGDVGGGHLQCHRLRQSHGILERGRWARVCLHSRPAARRAALRRVDTNEHPRSGRRVEADNDLFAVPRADELLQHPENLLPPSRLAEDPPPGRDPSVPASMRELASRTRCAYVAVRRRSACACAFLAFLWKSQGLLRFPCEAA